MKPAYYNENDPKAAAWLRELIRNGHIASGDVDERSIEDVLPGDLAGYAQCHFFAGIGGWSYALRLAGWPDERPVWTGSCPCQPFSAAGKGAGFADERHVWPAFRHLIQNVRPAIVFGEQVANALPWLDLVSRELETQGYAFGAAIIGAHSVGAPHIRQRLYFVAESQGQQQQHRCRDSGRGRGELADSGGLGDSDDEGSQGRRERRDSADKRSAWKADLVDCRDGKRRPVEPFPQQMAYGLRYALGLVRGYSHGEKEKIVNAAKSLNFIAEAVRQMQNGDAPAQIWTAFGRRYGFQETAVLLATLCEHARELGQFFYSEEESRTCHREEALREMFTLWPIACASQGRGLLEQPTVQLRDALPELPQESAWLKMLTGFPLAIGVSSRVGLLRGYGNAIVPQVAAAFISAYLETLA